MSKPGRKYKYEGLGSPLGASRGGDEARAKGGRAAPGSGYPRAERRAGAEERAARPEGPPGGPCGHRAPRTASLIHFLFPRGSGPAALPPPAPARAGPASSVSRAAAGAPMPRAAPRWPPLLLLSLLLLLQPIARGAPAQPGARRPASALVVPTRLAGGAGELALHLSAFGRGFVLRLAPDASFLAPGFKIERLGGSGAAAGGERELRACFFSGTVNGAPGSLAAVSLCGGLSGSFLLDGEEFTVQPRGAGDALQRPHLLQRWGPRAPAHPLPRGPEWGARRGDGPRSEREKEEKDEAPEEGSEGNESEGAREPPAAPRRAASRTKRFVSEARFVETLLVADASMAAFYGPDLQVGLLSPPGSLQMLPFPVLRKSFMFSAPPK